jgi:hypothetical protein
MRENRKIELVEFSERQKKAGGVRQWKLNLSVRFSLEKLRNHNGEAGIS